jgi:long-chain acyl-CoA synthetase
VSDPRTVLDLFAAWCAAKSAPVLVDARGGGDVRIPVPEVARGVAGLARGLRAIGVGKGDRVALIAGNRPEWHVVDLAVQHLGAVLVPIYPTLLAAHAGAILADSGAKVGVAENAEQLAKLEEAQPSCAELTRLVVIDGASSHGVCSLADCTEALETNAALEFLAQQRALARPDDLATLIYTSGTTGEPKGVMLTHDNFVSNVVDASSVMPWPPGSELALSFLPLSHVLERMLDYIYFYRGTSIAYCGILESGEVAHRVRPQVFGAVPRFFEKVHDRVMFEVSHAPKVKQALLRAALAAGLAHVRTGRRTLACRLFDPIVFAKIRAALGGRIRFAISGGAPLPVFIGEFFHAIGIRVLEGYGLTETSPVIAVNPYDHFKLGTVGPAIPGVEVRIGADGEILTRGRHVMKGYWGKPEATAAVIDGEGWFATGDIGELDAEGFLKVTDRKKDLLVTAGGKNIAPQVIEEKLKVSPLVENAVAFGDRKPYVVALIVPAWENLERWAAQHGVTDADRAALLSRPEVVAAFQAAVDAANHGLARFETVKKFRIVAEPFTIGGGELTPTLKVKRRVVAARYEAVLSAMYGESERQEKTLA